MDPGIEKLITKFEMEVEKLKDELIPLREEVEAVNVSSYILWEKLQTIQNKVIRLEKSNKLLNVP